MNNNNDNDNDNNGELNNGGVIIIGGGYAGLSCAQHVRELNPDVKITVLNQEPFCSRPNLFFRFKFPHWHEKHLDYNAGIITTTEDEDNGHEVQEVEESVDASKQKQQQQQHAVSFPKKHRLNFLDEYSALKVNAEQHSVTVLNRKTGETCELSYDRLCFATGGESNLIEFPLIETEQSDRSAHLLKDHTFQYAKYAQNVENMFAIRNVEEVRLLYSAIRKLHDAEENVNRNIVIIGSGALSLDIVTHIIDGYEVIYKQQNSENSELSAPSATKFQQVAKEIVWNIDDIQMDRLPKITILARKSTIANPLLQDHEASKMVTDMVLRREEDITGEDAKKFQISHYLNLVTEDSVNSILVSKQKNDEGRSLCVGVQTTNGKQIDCSIIIQAVGVNSNTKLASEAQVKIGAKGGILVNENFQCLSTINSSPIDGLFAAGDCVELSASYVGGGIDDKQSVVWKNWTSAREQAIECAKAMISPPKQPKTSSLWFNQTLRLFGLYVACLGMYHHENTNENGEPVLVAKSADHGKNRYFKLVFHKITEDQNKLIGSLVMGPDMTDFRLGSSVLDCLRQENTFSNEFASKMLELTPVQWTALIKLVKENRKNNLSALTEDQEKHVMNTVQTAVKKNPLLAKKGAPRKNPLLAKKKAPTTEEKKVDESVEQKLSELKL